MKVNKEAVSDIYDMIIIGAGPAGLTAGIYAARAKFKTLIIEKETIGGSITITNEVVNYPGVLRTSGKNLTEKMREQALRFGADIVREAVVRVDFSDEIKIVNTSEHEYKAFSVIIATGSKPRKVGFPGEEEFAGRGIAYCATCDGEFFTGKDVFVIGAGFAAVEESIFLTKYARKVTIIAREPDFTCAQTIADQAKRHNKIEIKFNSEIVEAKGNGVLQYAKFRNHQTNETWEYHVEKNDIFGIFVFIGYAPASDLFQHQIEIDQSGYIVTDRNRMTNVEGVYAAGDICIKNLRQVVTAVSDGAIAATSSEKYVQELREKYHVVRTDFKEVPTTIDDSDEIDESELNNRNTGAFIDDDIREQLKPIFNKFQSHVKLIAVLKKADSLSEEMDSFLEEVNSLSDKIQISKYYEDVDKELMRFVEITPSILFFNEKDEYMRVQYHAIPGGHEFNSFILALYNIAGPGQDLPQDTRSKLEAINKEYDLKVVMSLSCTMCPEVVMAVQRMAIENGFIQAQIIDVSRFPDIKQKYNIMSVPCLIMNDENVVFGKKTMDEILNLL